MKNKKITLQDAIAHIELYQKWRHGETDDFDCNPVKISVCINILIKAAKAGLKTKTKKANP